MTISELIKSDLFRYAQRTDWKAFALHFVRNRSFRYCLWLRLCGHPSPLISWPARFYRQRLSLKTGIQIPPGTKIGPGLYIGHFISVVVHPLTEIGANCNLSQFTTIGSNKNTPAKIGNNVYIGPGCSIVEDVTIGDNVIIGAGSVVVKNIPANCTAAGNPARVISQNHRDPEASNLWTLREGRPPIQLVDT